MPGNAIGKHDDKLTEDIDDTLPGDVTDRKRTLEDSGKNIKNTRRRLSISSVGDVPQENDEIALSIQKMKANESRFKKLVPEEIKANVGQQKVVNIKDIPQNIQAALKKHIRSRSSVAGVRASHFQEDFEKKCVKTTGSVHELNENGIGYVCRKGLKPESPNQDDFIIITTENLALYAIFDGHGPYGHDVSNFVQRELPHMIINNEYFLKHPRDVFTNAFLRIHDVVATTTHHYLRSLRRQNQKSKANLQATNPQRLPKINIQDAQNQPAQTTTEASDSSEDDIIAESSDDDDDDNDKDDFKKQLKKLLKKKWQHIKIPKPYFDCTMSGTTATILVHLYNEKKIYIAYVGDSRAVLGKRKKDETSKLTALELTKDHKPNYTDEKNRIIKSGGEVMKLEGDIPYRVFIKNKFYPGLAMSRALGDIIGHQIGIISNPDIVEVDVNEDEDVLVLICSDGVWEFISSEEAINLIYQFGYERVQEAVENLAKEAWDRWLEEEENIVDDITVQAVYLIDKEKAKTS